MVTAQHRGKGWPIRPGEVHVEDCQVERGTAFGYDLQGVLGRPGRHHVVAHLGQCSHYQRADGLGVVYHEDQC
jgi:hypothetical protein